MSIKVFAAIAMLAMVSWAGAQPALAGAEEPTSVAIRGIDPHPRTAAAADRLLHRIEDAALEACGGGAFSADALKWAVRRSECWRRAVSDAVASDGDPQLSQALQRRHPAWR
jgi:UrcA family protein